ncbi:EF-P 5-aminopentanol modification-associated protein YfmH [Melissococcus plutonius]|uniref:EF-P 5-aminopentanol modification-associated protein YfmH n=1 Tax=Melissococcus plutonius TaxID=33970 RepID=UPI003C2D3BAB
MHKLTYEQINETVYTEVLENGLTVYLIPKQDFHKTYALFTTNYGSIDNDFTPLNKSEFIKVPDGIAHFLEHKMFEKEEGDVFQKFGSQGASANAFTSFTKTSYLFSTTDQVKLNLTTLLDFVQSPYFTKETVEKEKGIIGQEIQMYQDDPDWRLFFGMIENLYPNHPLHIDIAGTIESIREITAEDLYTCYNTFYHPSNMKLVVVGNIDPDGLMALIYENQATKPFARSMPIKRHFPKDSISDIIQERQVTLPVVRPKVLLGIKGIDKEVPKESRAKMKYQLMIELLLQLLLGNTSKNYLALYDQGLLDDSFSYEFNLDRGFHFAVVGGDSDYPEKLAQRMEEILLQAANSPDITETNLMLVKRKMIGKYLQSLNSLEYVANQFSQFILDDKILFDKIAIIESIQLQDILITTKFFQKDRLSRFYIYPKKEA